MFKGMFLAGALCLASSGMAMAATSSSVPANHAARSAAEPHPPKIFVQTPFSSARAFTSLHFAIRGRTATWAFQFSCDGAHCGFRNTHHLRDVADPGYVTIAAVFDDEATPQGEAQQAAPTGGSEAACITSNMAARLMDD